jgi:regulatory protein
VPFQRSRRTIIDEASLYNYAISALGQRMRTVAELKRLMRRRVPEGEIGTLLVEMVILRLKEQKYLNDSNYAASYSAYRRDTERFGRRRVATDLKVKGVHPEVIDKAVNEAYAGVDELAQARTFLKRKRLKKPATNKESARIFRALMRAGFTLGASIRVLKDWKVDDDLLAALEEETKELEG